MHAQIIMLTSGHGARVGKFPSVPCLVAAYAQLPPSFSRSRPLSSQPVARPAVARRYRRQLMVEPTNTNSLKPERRPNTRAPSATAQRGGSQPTELVLKGGQTGKQCHRGAGDFRGQSMSWKLHLVYAHRQLDLFKTPPAQRQPRRFAASIAVPDGRLYDDRTAPLRLAGTWCTLS